MAENKSIEWLRKHRKFINISALEVHLGMPRITLIRVMLGTRPFPEKYGEALEKWIAGLGEKVPVKEPPVKKVAAIEVKKNGKAKSGPSSSYLESRRAGKLK